MSEQAQEKIEVEDGTIPSLTVDEKQDLAGEIFAILVERCNPRDAADIAAVILAASCYSCQPIREMAQLGAMQLLADALRVTDGVLDRFPEN